MTTSMRENCGKPRIVKLQQGALVAMVGWVLSSGLRLGLVQMTVEF